MDGKVGEKDLCDPLESEGREAREGRPQQVLCSRADCDSGLDWRREGRGNALEVTCLLRWPEWSAKIVLYQVYFVF